MKISKAAERLGINYENAKAINSVYKKEGRTHRLNERQADSGSTYSEEVRLRVTHECPPQLDDVPSPSHS